MSPDRSPALDLVALAEDVLYGRRSLDNVIDQISVATPDDRARRAAVAELQALVVGLGAVRAHAAAVAQPRDADAAGPARTFDLPPTRVRARPRRPIAIGGLLAGAAGAVGAVVIVAIVVASLRPAPSVGGPSIGPSGIPSGTPAPSTSAAPSAAPSASGATPSPSEAAPSPSRLASPVPTPVSTPPATPIPTIAPTIAPVPTAAAGLPEIPSSPVAGPVMEFWSLIARDRLQVWLWNPQEPRLAERLAVDTWPGPQVQRTVLIASRQGYIAIHEIDTTTNSPVQRLRVFRPNGDLVWTAPKLPPVTAMAWSTDGTALAIGSLPVPWTVVQLNGTASPDVTTYNLDDQDGYALLGFSGNGNTLYGYGTGGEADFWDKPVAVDRARGRLTHLDAMPGGSPALSLGNSTAPVGQFDREGRAVVLAGGAKGDLHWVVRAGADETPVVVGPDAQLTWGPDGTLVALSRVPVSDDNGLAVRRLDATGGELPGAVALPAGAYAAVLAGVRDGFALVTLIPVATQGEPQPVREVLLVDLASGRIAVGLPPLGADGAGFEFAGWIGPSA